MLSRIHSEGVGVVRPENAFAFDRAKRLRKEVGTPLTMSKNLNNPKT